MYFLYQLGLIQLMLCSGAEATSRVGLIVNNQNSHASFVPDRTRPNLLPLLLSLSQDVYKRQEQAITTSEVAIEQLPLLSPPDATQQERYTVCEGPK